MIVNINNIPDEKYFRIKHEIMMVLMNNDIPYEIIRELDIKDGDSKDYIGIEFNIK